MPRILRPDVGAHMEVLLPSGVWKGIGLNDWPSRAGAEYLAARGREAKPVRVAVTESRDARLPGRADPGTPRGFRTILPGS